jgi:hypothetical protein
MSLALTAHRMKRRMCSLVVGPVDCHRSMWPWVTCSTVVLCSAVSLLQNSIVTVTVCLARLHLTAEHASPAGRRKGQSPLPAARIIHSSRGASPFI